MSTKGKKLPLKHSGACEMCGKNFKSAVFWRKFCGQSCKQIAFGARRAKEMKKTAKSA